jgi:transposase
MGSGEVADVDVEIQRVRAELMEAREQLSAQQADEADVRARVERELRSAFSEAAAESHVADVEAFEQQLQMCKDAADEQVRTVCTCAQILLN